MKKQYEFSEYIRNLYPDDLKVTCPSITFQVTDDCCLNCSYCYQINKGHRMMSKDIAKQGIDLLFNMYDENKEEQFINHHTKGVILDFIGGEPLMNIDTISYISQYFIDKCVEKDHIWLTNFKFNIGSNGLLYFEPKVQEYLKKFLRFIHLNITIDGPQYLHDRCRRDFNNQGSFDRSIAAFRHWRDFSHTEPSTKVTIAPENLNYLHEIISFFIKEKCVTINANPIHEHNWTVEEAQIYYKQLKIVADKLLQNPEIETNLFHHAYGRPMLSTDNFNYCGGVGAMLAFDPDGIAYPCIRYMESSLGNEQPPLIIGNTKGIYNTESSKEILNSFQKITRRTQSNDECWNCPITNGCAWCSAWNYQQFGTCNKRSTNICWMHRARSLVNSYYYNKLFQEEGSSRRIPIYLDRNIATKIINDEEYDNLLELSFWE